MIDYTSIINKYIKDEELRHILVTHSRAVADKALRIASAHPELHVDRVFVEEAAMLHDIGVVGCDASGIKCHGAEPYICHGVIGAEMLRKEGLPQHARVCERHTGAGITLDEIKKQGLPLPEHSYLPETLEEKLICYADKFFSKTKLDREKTIEQAEVSLAKFGDEGVKRFKEWVSLFG